MSTNSVVGFLGGLALLFASACGGDDSSASVAESCEKGCMTATSLKCPDDPPTVSACVDSCKAEYEALKKSAPACEGKLAAVLACGAARPASDWQCEDGEAELKDTACENEAAAAIACLFTGK